MSTYPKATTDGYAFETQQDEALSLESKTYNSGSRSIRIKLLDDRTAIIRRLDDKEMKNHVAPGINSFRSKAAKVTGNNSPAEDFPYLMHAVLISECCKFDGELISVEQVLLIPVMNFISLQIGSGRLNLSGAEV